MRGMKISALMALAAACAAAPALAQKSKDTLRFPVPDPDAGIDTYQLPSSFNNVWGPSVYDHLLGCNGNEGKFVGHLARSWAQPSPTVYEYELHEDVLWHDGQKFTADDVVYSIKRLVSPELKAPLAWRAPPRPAMISRWVPA